ncbi:MAG: hypothetical protein ABSF22_09225 [Bryobacteraceae bacterium]
MRHGRSRQVAGADVDRAVAAGLVAAVDVAAAVADLASDVNRAGSFQHHIK